MSGSRQRKSRVERLEDRVDDQQQTIKDLVAIVNDLQDEMRDD